MLKNYYASEEEIPEGLKSAYIAKNGRYELDILDTTHPAIVAKNEIETKYSTVKSENQENLNKLARLEGNSLPQGKVAVDPEIETLGNAAKQCDLSADQIPALKTKSDDLESKIESIKSEAVTAKAVAAIGLNPNKFLKLKGERNLSIETVADEKDGEKFFVVSKDDKGVESKKDLDEFLKTDDFFGTFYGDLKLSDDGKQWVEQESGTGGNPARNVYDEIRHQKETEQKQSSNNLSFAEKFSGKTAAIN